MKKQKIKKTPFMSFTLEDFRWGLDDINLSNLIDFPNFDEALMVRVEYYYKKMDKKTISKKTLKQSIKKAAKKVAENFR